MTYIFYSVHIYEGTSICGYHSGVFETQAEGYEIFKECTKLMIEVHKNKNLTNDDIHLLALNKL